MKKILFVLTLLTAITSFAGEGNPEINQSIIKSFNSTFVYAQDVVWQQRDDVYQANFWQGGINIRAKYDERGNLLGTIRYYFEKQLSPTILCNVKKQYAGKSIFGITEVTSDGDISYFITMQDSKHWYTIQSDAYGNLHQTEKFRKTDPDQ